MRQKAGSGAIAATLFFILLAGVVVSPLPLGSNRAVAWSACALWAAFLAAAWAIAALLGQVRVSRLPGVLPVAGFGVVCTWAWLQTQPWLPPVWSHPLWNMLASVAETPVTATVSLAPDDGAVAGMRYLCYGLVFGVAFQLGRDPVLARRFLRVFAAAGLVLAVYGLVAYFGRHDSLLGLWPLEYRPAVRATFMNRNSFATWLGLTMLCQVTLTWQRFARRGNPAYRLPQRDFARRLERFLVQAWRPIAVLMVMSAALFLTGSRGGFIATVFGMSVLVLALSSRQQGGVRRWWQLALLLGIGVAFWVSSSGLVERLERSGADLVSRMEAYELAADGVEDNPLLGFGYGTFADSFRLYRDERVKGHFDMAHNTYLENAFELGWPVAVIQFLVVGLLCAGCWRGWRAGHVSRAFPALGMAATALVALHSLVDFSLQIPATAIAFSALMGVSCAQSRPGPIYSG